MTPPAGRPCVIRCHARGGDPDAGRSGRRRGPEAVPAAGGCDVRARGRHVVHERLDLRRGPRSGCDRERRPGDHRARGARLRRLHPDRGQDRRPDRAEAGVRDRPPGVCHRRGGDGAGAEPHRRDRLLGDHRRTGRVPAPARDAIAGPRQLRGRSPEKGLRHGRRRGRRRRCGRAAPRRLHHDVPVVACRLRARGCRDRGGAAGDQARARRRVHRSRARSTSSARSSR